MKHNRLWACGLLAIAISSVGLPNAWAKGGGGNPNPGILPPWSNAFSADYGEWAAGWMQWALGIGADQNPLTDETGAFAHVGQHGKVWYLAGTLGDQAPADVPLTATERVCTVPPGKAIFFPVVNTFFFRTEEEEPTDPEVIWDMLVGWLTADMYCEIDGQPVENLEAYLTMSPIFDLVLPEDNLWAGWGLPGGTYGPAATAGYYLMLTPPSKGAHTIRIIVRDEWEGDGGPMRWGFDVTYLLTVGH